MISLQIMFLVMCIISAQIRILYTNNDVNDGSLEVMSKTNHKHEQYKRAY